MAWDETTQEKYRRNAERYESDLTDGEWEVIEPPVPPPCRLASGGSGETRGGGGDPVEAEPDGAPGP